MIRNENIDSVKFWLITLVIIGHVFSQNQFSPINTCTIVWHWIYMFHMPLFIFLSGYFSCKKDNKSFFLSCWKLTEPLLIFQLIMRSFQFIISGTISVSSMLTPWWVLWYLLSLLYWRTILQIIPNKILNNKKLVLLCAFCIGLLAGFLPFNRLLSLQRTFSFMPFFFIGYYMRGKNLFLPSKYKIACALFLLFTILIPIFFPQYLGDLNQAEPYNNPFYVYYRILIYGLSIPMSIAFMNLCPTNMWIAKQGKLTIQYYIYHAFIIYILMKIVTKFGLPTSFGAAIAYVLLIMIVIGLLLKIPLFSKLTNPSLFFKKN